MDWVGKYFVGGLIFSLGAKHRTRSMTKELAARTTQFCQTFAKFPTYAAHWLSATQWRPTQVPCMFNRADGTLMLFCFAPGDMSSVSQEQATALAEFMTLYQEIGEDLTLALELSRDGARDEAICLIWDEHTGATDVGQWTTFAANLLKVQDA